MRKFILFLLLITSFYPVFAMKYDTGSTLPLQGGYGAVLNVEVETLKAQSNEYMAGMPFNIADRSVQPSSSGRAIAEWSVLANSGFNIRINAAPLKHISEPHEPLNYDLTFQYELGYVAFGEEVKKVGEIEVSSTNHTATIEEQVPYSLMQDASYDSGYLIGSVDGMIFFTFVDGTEITDDLPVGEYTARVDILIESGE